MNTPQQGEYISIQQGCQQLKLEICGVGEYKAEKDEFYRQVSAQLEELDYPHGCTDVRNSTKNGPALLPLIMSRNMGVRDLTEAICLSVFSAIDARQQN